MNNKETLEKELTTLLNKHCVENDSNTPDFILAQYLMECLILFNRTIMKRSQWYGRHDVPGKDCEVFDFNDHEWEK